MTTGTGALTDEEREALAVSVELLTLSVPPGIAPHPSDAAAVMINVGDIRRVLRALAARAGGQQTQARVDTDLYAKRRHNRCGLGDMDSCGHPVCPDVAGQQTQAKAAVDQDWREAFGQDAMLAMRCTHSADEFGRGAVCVTCWGNVQRIGAVVEKLLPAALPERAPTQAEQALERVRTADADSVEQRLVRIGMRSGLTESARAMLNLCITEVRRG